MINVSFAEVIMASWAPNMDICSVFHANIDHGLQTKHVVSFSCASTWTWVMSPAFHDPRLVGQESRTIIRCLKFFFGRVINEWDNRKFSRYCYRFQS